MAKLNYCYSNMAEKQHHPAKYYPELTIPKNTKPNRWFAIPFIGFFIKVVLTLPVLIWFSLLSVAYFALWLITPFVILFKGKYWDTAYTFMVGYLKLYLKIGIYYYGLTDKYPGFSMSDDGLFKLEIAKPTKPRLLLSFPIFGILVRIILIIPYAIFESVLYHGSQIALFLTWFAVLFKGKYPDRFYQFNHDALRVSLAETLYMSYLSDVYPSFKISTKYKKTVIALLIGGAILAIVNALPPDNEYQHRSTSSFNESTMPESFDYPKGY